MSTFCQYFASQNKCFTRSLLHEDFSKSIMKELIFEDGDLALENNFFHGNGVSDWFASLP